MSDPNAETKRLSGLSHFSRRSFLRWSCATAVAGSTCPAFLQAHPSASSLRIGLIADLHQDLVPDARMRLDQFLESSSSQRVDAIFQLGDFATPIVKNKEVIEAFNNAGTTRYHVIGNHDTDGGASKEQVVDQWGMSHRFYAVDIRGIKFIVLDANDRPRDHRGGYPAHIAEDQIEWLTAELQHTGPMIVISHQPLAGPAAIDNAAVVQQLLSKAADRVLLALNVHTHIDELIELNGIHYWHVNSASYYWVGGSYKHESLPPDVHAKYPAMSSTCPYRDPLFAFLEVDVESRSLAITGRQSTWIGSSPADLGVPSKPELRHGQQIVPEIRERKFEA